MLLFYSISIVRSDMDIIDFFHMYQLIYQLQMKIKETSKQEQIASKKVDKKVQDLSNDVNLWKSEQRRILRLVCSLLVHVIRFLKVQ